MVLLTKIHRAARRVGGCFRPFRSRLVKHNQTLDYIGLRDEAARAAAGLTQSDLAQRLGVSQPAVSLALREAGSKRAALQQQLIEALTDYTIEDQSYVVFRVIRKPQT